MVIHGVVRDGVVVLGEDAHFAEGEAVMVIASKSSDEMRLRTGSGSHSVLDIPTVSLGAVLRPVDANDDLLEEMLEGRL